MANPTPVEISAPLPKQSSKRRLRFLLESFSPVSQTGLEISALAEIEKTSCNRIKIPARAEK